MIKSPVRGSDIAVSDIYGDGDDIAEGETLSCGSAFKGGALLILIFIYPPKHQRLGRPL